MPAEVNLDAGVRVLEFEEKLGVPAWERIVGDIDGRAWRDCGLNCLDLREGLTRGLVQPPKSG